MPKIQWKWKDLPEAIREHLKARLKEREIAEEDLFKLREWSRSEPEVPDGAWYKDFGSFKICGEGPLPKTFLLKGQSAKGKQL